MKFLRINLWWFSLILLGTFAFCFEANVEATIYGESIPSTNFNTTVYMEYLGDSEEFRHKQPLIKPPNISNIHISIPKCSRNEEYLSCGPICEDECTKRCTGDFNTGCKKGCFCKTGYIRYLSGRCILLSSCPKPVCPRYEEWKECEAAPYCDAKCGSFDGKCEEKTECPGCFCRRGYYRHQITNNCTYYHQCPPEIPQCPEWEEYKSCGYTSREQCQIYVSNLYQEKCNPGCFCVSGFVRIDGQCVPRQQCPRVCPTNEEYSSCGYSCREYCSISDKDCGKSCESGCFCIAGYKRVGGVCVPTSNCPPPSLPICPGPNEIYTTCGKSCDEDCSKTPKDCLNTNCEFGCFCKPNYKRVDDMCVPEDECKSTQCSDENEIYSTCGNSCYEDCGKNIYDCQDEKCYEGCFCAKGYKRIDDVCVPDYECGPPKCPGPNEVYTTCGRNCDEDCNVPSICIKSSCNAGCYCNDGYKRINGTCVPESQCTPPLCGPYEIYSTCGRICDEECEINKASCTIGQCYSGCFCQSGYKRINGRCVSESLCGCSSNEEYVVSNDCIESCFKTESDCVGVSKSLRCTCKAGYRRINGLCVKEDLCQCPPNEEYINGNSCQEKCKSSPNDCKSEEFFKECFCIEGYRRISGQCMKDSLCPCGRFEEYTYGSECYEECSKDPKLCRFVDTYKRCSCIEGYKRINGYCSPDFQCICPINEETAYTNDCYEQCGHNPETCAEQATFRRCACKEGYVRVNGICIPDSNCPCSHNEEYAVGNLCEEDCSSTPDSCRDTPSYKRCSCKYGYKRINDQCVEYQNCPCRKNEYYTYGNDCKEGCVNTEECKGLVDYLRCTCLPLYKRINGKCIPESKCQCGKNEQYGSAVNDCFDICGTNQVECAGQETYSQCVCINGYKRVNGICVPYSECPCAINEIFAVSNPCYDQCGSNPIDCFQMYSYGQCVCQAGYRRFLGVCIPDSNCPCGENEEYTASSECIENCGTTEDTCKNEYEWKRCTCLEQFKRIDGICVPDTECGCPPNEHMDTMNDCFEICGANHNDCGLLPVVRKCFCNKGYVRVNGVCLEDSVCSCPDNEVYGYTNDCFEQCGTRDEECKALYSHRYCGCKANYKRIDGVCFPDSNCPCPENSSYNYGNECYETCGANPAECAKLPTQTRCICNDGFVRIDGNCVPESQCSCGNNEEYTNGNECIEDCSKSNLVCRTEPSYKRCTCIAGHKRIDDVCVLDTNCFCETNEVYIFGSHCREDCRNNDTDCFDSECYRGCFCAQGYKRFGDTCQSKDTCQCGLNEEYNCGWNCKDDCTRLNLQCLLNPCRPGCYCKDGFRRIDGICQLQDQCRCDNNNEEFKCGKRCLEDCSKTPLDCITDVCTFGCFCRNPIHRRINGICSNILNCRILTDRALDVSFQ